jgi:hypothetical protein
VYQRTFFVAQFSCSVTNPLAETNHGKNRDATTDEKRTSN